jgi:UPF0716 protein FxsA
MKFQILLLLFISVPILEIYLLISVGSLIGVLPTVLLVIFTAVLGTYLLRAQGLATLQKMQATLEQGQMPAEALFEGVFLLVGGALLLTPGFFTDALGFLCLMPFVRKFLIAWLIQRIYMASTMKESPMPKRGPSTIEGEYRREDK